MTTEPYDLEAFLQRNKWDIGSIMLALCCIPLTRDMAIALLISAPLCALFICISGILLSRIGIVISAALSLVFMAALVFSGASRALTDLAILF